MSEIIVSISKPDKELIQESKIILLLSFTVWLVVMNTTMFNIALPTVLTELTLTSSTASWIVSGYSIAFAISTLTFSRLSDFIPISKLLFIGLLILGMASILGFFSHHFYLVLTARILQATGAGAVPGLAMVVAGRYIPVVHRGKAMAYIASAASLGFGLGPVFGGFITQYLGWNYLFFVTGFVIVLIPLFNKFLPKEKLKKGKFDTIGGLLTGIGISGLLLFLTTFSAIILVGSIVLLIVVWRHIQKKETPFIQPHLIKNKQYMKLLFIGFMVFVTHFATLFLMPIILTTVFNKEPVEVGVLIFPGAILSAVAAQFIGRLIDHFGNTQMILIGEGLLITATIMFALTATNSPNFILITYMFMSVGFSALTSSITNEITRILPKSDIGSGMGLASLLQFIGGAFGVTATGIMLTLREGLLPKLVYQELFIGLTVILTISLCAFIFYQRTSKCIVRT